MHDQRRTENGATMRKTKTPSATDRPSDDLRPENGFDYSKAKANRFAGQSIEEQVVVLLDPDVSEVFRTPDSVNSVLRALIQAMPPKVRDKAIGPEQVREPGSE